MRAHTELERLQAEAEYNRRCFQPATDAARKAVARRVRDGYLIRAHRNVYVRAEYWGKLNPAEKARHIIRTLSRQYPNWIFSGISAAAMLGLEYHWQLHREQMVYIASKSGNASRTNDHLQRISMTDAPVCEVIHRRADDNIVVTITGKDVTFARQTAIQRKTQPQPITGEITDIVCVTSPARTLVDCGLRYTFKQALPMFDSALRKHLVTPEQVILICDGLSVDCGPVFRLLHYANPLSENGGESLCRAVIIEAGFAVPELQHVFFDPDVYRAEYRVDFVWHTQDGRTIVLEYDGTSKYVDPSMTNRHSVQQVVHDERSREDALRRAKVTTVIRTNYDEVMMVTPLVRKLMEADVPMSTTHPFLERATDVDGRMR